VRHLHRISILIACLLLTRSISFSQDTALVDSLMSELKCAKADTSFLNLNLDLGSEYLFNSPDTAKFFIDQAFQYAVNLDDSSNIAECYNLYGIIGTIQGKYLTGIENFQQSLTWYELVGDHRGAANIINNIGVIYGYLENFEESIRHYKESYEISISINDTSGAALNLFNVAAEYIELENYDSLRYYCQLLEKFQGGEDKYISSAPLKGELFLHEDRLDSAEACYNRALKYQLKKQDQVQAMSSLLGLAEIYKEQSRWEDAIRTLDEFETFSLRHEFNDYLLEVYELRSEVMEATGNFAEALN
jgi:tetratricopeptide (TPR) repeat protein